MSTSSDSSTILVVDDMAIFRELLAHALSAAGYRVTSAANGQEAMEVLNGESPQLILLDLAMPVMDGMTFLQTLRKNPEAARLPVILLTASSEKPNVVAAARLGVHDYLLKSAFSVKELLSRVRRYVVPADPAAAARNAVGKEKARSTPSVSPIAAAQTPPLVKPTASAKVADTPTIPKLLTRGDCCHRAEEALQAKTLSGVVMQVVALAASPRGDIAELATLISRDPVLSARVLQAANSAAYASNRGVVSTIPDAVRNIGCATIRNIAAALGIFEAMPQTAADGFNPIRCWQHSFGVARLCEQLVSHKHPEMAGTAYLAGLCHDLGDILFHTHFGREHQKVVEVERQTGKPRSELERIMLGMTHGELVLTILRCIGLPESIQRPIEMFHQTMEGRYAEAKDPLARVLRLAEFYANGILLASSGGSLVTPLSRTDCRSITGQEHPNTPDNAQLRSQVLALTGMLARLSPAEEAQLMVPLYRSTEARICVVREPVFSSFDPIAAVFESLGQVEVFEHAPSAAALKGYQGLLLVSHGSTAAGFDEAAVGAVLEAAQAGGIKSLWLTPRGRKLPDRDAAPAMSEYPTTVDRLAELASVD